jgi:hypothetical protein
MKLCKDCKNFKGGYLSQGYCEAPINGFSLVDGTIKAKLAITARRAGGLADRQCGPDALYFEEKPIAWYKFWK